MNQNIVLSYHQADIVIDFCMTFRKITGHMVTFGHTDIPNARIHNRFVKCT